MKAEALKQLVEQRMQVRKHRILWLMQNKIVGTALCERCRLTASYAIRPEPRESPVKGAALVYHCEGNPLTYDEIWQMFDEAGHPRSIILGPDLRLVILAEDRYGLQFRNTYLLRISQNGMFVYNTNGRKTPEALKVLNAYGPVELSPVGCSGWEFPDGTPYRDLCVVDLAGSVMPPPNPMFVRSDA